MPQEASRVKAEEPLGQIMTMGRGILLAAPLMLMFIIAFALIWYGAS